MESRRLTPPQIQRPWRELLSYCLAIVIREGVEPRLNWVPLECGRHSPSISVSGAYFVVIISPCSPTLLVPQPRRAD